MVDKLPKWQRVAIVAHAYNLFREMDCVGLKEGASAEEAKQAPANQGLTQKLEIPQSWAEANTSEAEFKYVHSSQSDKIITMKVTEIEGGKVKVSFTLAVRNPGVMSSAPQTNQVLLEATEAEFATAKFDNLDAWFPDSQIGKHYKEHLDRYIIKAAPSSGIF